jgi:hypothetical protein
VLRSGIFRVEPSLGFSDDHPRGILISILPDDLSKTAPKPARIHLSHLKVSEFSAHGLGSGILNFTDANSNTYFFRKKESEQDGPANPLTPSAPEGD